MPKRKSDHQGSWLDWRRTCVRALLPRTDLQHAWRTLCIRAKTVQSRRQRHHGLRLLSASNQPPSSNSPKTISLVCPCTHSNKIRVQDSKSDVLKPHAHSQSSARKRVLPCSPETNTPEPCSDSALGRENRCQSRPEIARHSATGPFCASCRSLWL